MPLARPSSLSCVEQRGWRQSCAVDARQRRRVRNRSRCSVGLVRRVLGANGALDRRTRRHSCAGSSSTLPSEEECSRLASTRERRLAALVPGDRDLVLLGELEQLGARGEVPFAPRRDDLDVGLQRVIGELEAHLVVAFAGRAVRHGVGADLFGDLDLALARSAGGRSRCRAGTGLHTARWRGTSERRSRGRMSSRRSSMKSFRLDAEQLGLLARRAELLALAEIGGEGDDLAAVGRLQPAQDHAGVEAAGIGEHDLLHILLPSLVANWITPLKKRRAWFDAYPRLRSVNARLVDGRWHRFRSGVNRSRSHEACERESTHCYAGHPNLAKPLCT